MDQTLLLVLAVAAIVALGAWALIRMRINRESRDLAGDPPLATSTEGMKVCSACGMGNLWTERRCSACGKRLRG
jgi:hypothetical protein